MIDCSTVSAFLHNFKNNAISFLSFELIISNIYSRYYRWFVAYTYVLNVIYVIQNHLFIYLFILLLFIY